MARGVRTGRLAVLAPAIFALALALTLTGCWARPVNDVGFGEVTRLSDLEGVYRNVGERAPGFKYPVYYLSALIWPGDEALDHAAIDVVEVRQAGEKTLHVSGVRADGTPIQEGVFVEGRDFTMRDGRIVLVHRPGIAGFHDGDPVLGLYVEGKQLGVDKRGAGKYRERVAVAGLVFAFLPVAVLVTEDIRFEKIAP